TRYSVLIARSSAFSYSFLNSETGADTTTLPSTAISNVWETVSPITSAERSYFTATCWIPETLFRSHEITIRLASSPNSTNSTGSCWEVRSTRAPTPRAIADSARLTAIPPSEQSWTESTNPELTISTIAFWSAASLSNSSSGGYPQTE